MDLVATTRARLLFAGMGLNENVAYDGLVGWVQRSLLSKWFRHEEGWIAKSEFNRQMYVIAENLKQIPLLPLAARRLPVSPSEINQARNHRFVAHLAMVDIEASDLDPEIVHYIRFIREKMRLAETGNFLPEHWLERGDRLKEYWRVIRREHCMNSSSESKAQTGQRILNDASKLREPLAHVAMTEAYMTIGHLHRLADEDRVAWHPDFACYD